MKRYVIGDIHGCYDELKVLIHKIQEHSGPHRYKMIFVGDYVDRGPNSKEVVELVRYYQDQGHIALMGNHEELILSNEMMYASQTLISFNGTIYSRMPMEVLDWMSVLPKYYEDDTIIVAHAAAKPNVPMNEQTDTYLLWLRYPRAECAGLPKHFYHGHTPTHGYIERTSDRTNVDTGCVYGGHLTAAVVGDDGAPTEFIQVRNKTREVLE